MTRTPFSLTEPGAGTDLKYFYASTTAGALTFGTLNDSLSTLTERMRITNAGNLGLATTSPWRTFSAVGTVGLSSTLTSATTGNYLCINTFSYEVTSGTTCSASSERFKEDINPLSYGLSIILKLNPVSFRYKKEVWTPTPLCVWALSQNKSIP